MILKLSSTVLLFQYSFLLIVASKPLPPYPSKLGDQWIQIISDSIIRVLGKIQSSTIKSYIVTKLGPSSPAPLLIFKLSYSFRIWNQRGYIRRKCTAFCQQVQRGFKLSLMFKDWQKLYYYNIKTKPNEKLFQGRLLKK